MRFSIRQLLIVVSFIALWLGSVVRGTFLLGSIGGVVFGLLAGAAVFLLSRLCLSTGKRSLFSKMIVSCFATIAFYTILFPGHVMREYWYFEGIQRHHRQAIRLEAILNLDPRFRGVDVEYIGAPGRRGNRLEVKGHVEDAPTLDKLTSLIEQMDDWPIQWSVKTADH
jgi:hypothetical protein